MFFSDIFKVISAVLLVLCMVLFGALAIKSKQLELAKEKLAMQEIQQETLKADLRKAREDEQRALKRLDDALAWAKANPAPKDPAKLAAWVKELEAKR